MYTARVTTDTGREPAERPLFAFTRRRVAPVVASLAAGLFCVIAPRLDRTLGRPLRAHGGDLALAMFLFLGAGAVTTITARTRAIAVLVLLCGIEVSQLFRSPSRSGLLVELTVGTTFDWLDVIAFVVGVAVAAVIETRRDQR